MSKYIKHLSVQFSTQLCPTLCNLMDCSMPVSVHHQLLELTQAHVHWVSDAIQPSHSLLIPSPLVFNLSQDQGLPVSQFFTSVGQSIGASASASVLPKNIQDWFPLGWSDWISSQSKGLSRVSSNFKCINSLAFSFLYSLILTSIHDYWKNHSFDKMDLYWQSNVSNFNSLSRLVIAFLPRSKCLSG